MQTDKEKIKKINRLLKKYGYPEYAKLRLEGLEVLVIYLALCLMGEKRVEGADKKLKFPILEECKQCGCTACFAYYIPEKKVSVRCMNGECGMGTPVCESREVAWGIWNGCLGD